MNQISIYDVSGKQILIKNLDSSNFILDTSELTNGIYLLNINVEGKLHVKRLVIQR
jgi:hypothetical protein